MANINNYKKDITKDTTFEEFNIPIELNQTEILGQEDLMYISAKCSHFTMFTSNKTGRDIVLMHFAEGTDLSSGEVIEAFNLMQVVPQPRQDLNLFLAPLVRQMHKKSIAEAAQGSEETVYLKIYRNEQDPNYVNWRANTEVVVDCLHILANK